MKNVHIALVGGQIYPVYLGIANEKPDEIWLIHSKETKDLAKRIASLFLISFELVELDPVDVKDVFTMVQDRCESIKEATRYTINITGGTKIWSIAFFKFFINRDDAKLIYIDQNNIIYDLKTLEDYEASVSADLNTLMQLNNHKPKYKLFSDYTEEDATALERIEDLRKINIRAFNNLTILEPKVLNKKENQLDDGESWIRWDRGKKIVELTIGNKHYFDSQVFTNPHIFDILFNTGWFEYKVALIMSEFSFTQEIWKNVIFPAQNNAPKNEIDVIVKIWDKFIFIECKTQVSKKTDIDKFNNAVKNYGGMGCKALFITDSKPSHDVIEKFNDSNVLHFAFKDYDTLSKGKKALQELIETELFDISPR